MDKENERVTAKSKIPLPKEPLPPLSKTLIKRQKEIKNERHPLKTIHLAVHPNINGVELKSEKVHPKHPKGPEIDNRYITHRQNTDDLDWNYQVFKDSTRKNCSIVIKSDDHDDENKDNQAGNYFVNNHDKNCLEEAKKPLTPVLKSLLLVPNKVKNLKRSLKRPHSRELQGLSPQPKQERGDESHKRRLEFTEPSDRRLESSDFWKKSYMTCFNRDYTDDMFNYLFSTEKKTLMPRIISKTRACILNWLMKVNGIRGNPAVLQSALWYLDALLTASNVRMESLQLVAAGCYWIAQKTHGQAYSARRLVRAASLAFNCKHLMAAEKAILYKLNFPSQPIIPQDFITYLSWCCDSNHRGEIEMAATFLCMAGMMIDKALCHEYPSVIAAAAVRNAVLLLQNKEAVLRLHMNSVYSAAVKKTSNISMICSIQRKAVCCMSSPYYKYNALLEYYGVDPHFIAQKIINSVNDL